MSILPRVILLKVCLLELQNPVLCMIGVLRGGRIEITLNAPSCFIFRFLSNRHFIRNKDASSKVILYTYLECRKGCYDIVNQNIHEYLLGIGLYNCCGPQVTV